MEWPRKDEDFLVPHDQKKLYTLEKGIADLLLSNFGQDVPS